MHSGNACLTLRWGGSTPLIPGACSIIRRMMLQAKRRTHHGVQMALSAHNDYLIDSGDYFNRAGNDVHCPTNTHIRCRVVLQPTRLPNAAMPDRTIIQWDKDDLVTMNWLNVDCLALGRLVCMRKCLDLLRTHCDLDTPWRPCLLRIRRPM